MKVTWTETHEEEIDFDNITDWSRYPGETVCIAHGWHEPKSRALSDEFERRAKEHREKQRIERDKKIAAGDPVAKDARALGDFLFETLRAGTNMMVIEKFGEEKSDYQEYKDSILK